MFAHLSRTAPQRPNPFARARPKTHDPLRWRGVLGSLLLASLAHAQTPLTLDAAMVLAQQRSQQLVAQDAAALAAREMAVAAGARPDPVLKLALTNLPLTGAQRYSLGADFMTQRSIGVMQELTRADKRQARSGRFERQAERAQAAHAQALAELHRDTTLAWLDRHFLERRLALQLTLRTETALQVEAADAAFRSGRGSQADLFASRSAVAWIDDNLAETRRDIATAQTRLARWIGAQAAQQPLATAPQVLLPTDISDNELALRVHRHPRVALAVRAQDAAQSEVEVARSELRADWTLELMFSQRGPGFSNMASVNLSVPLQWDQDRRQNREIAARLALTEQLRGEREETEREQLAQARGTLLAWQHNHRRLQHIDQQLLPLAAERNRAALTTYRAGNGTLDAVLQARRAEIDTALQRLMLEQENARLWAQLNYLIPHPADTLADARTTR